MPRHFSLRSEGACDIPAFDLINKNQGGGDDFQLPRSMFLFGTLFPQRIRLRSETRGDRRSESRAFLIGAGLRAITAPKELPKSLPKVHKIAVRITRRLKIPLESALKVFGGTFGLTSLFSMATAVVGLMGWREPHEGTMETG